MEIYLKISNWVEKPKHSGHYNTNDGRRYFDHEIDNWFLKKEHIADENCKPIGDIDYWFKPIELK